ncbi:MAG: NGG1p interacting factor NIF3, partial [Endomicrobiia bacterium]|nr:NGG1p interacting factor NIF3 [Endomicrobiia bacterium]
MPELRDIYRAAVEAGMKADPRGIGAVRGELVREKEKFEKLSDEEKKEFDSEKLVNPYADTRILHETESASEIKTALVGIDMETPEILLCE